jgi:hypothetical protein
MATTLFAVVRACIGCCIQMLDAESVTINALTAIMCTCNLGQTLQHHLHSWAHAWRAHLMVSPCLWAALGKLQPPLCFTSRYTCCWSCRCMVLRRIKGADRQHMHQGTLLSGNHTLQLSDRHSWV